MHVTNALWGAMFTVQRFVLRHKHEKTLKPTYTPSESYLQTLFSLWKTVNDVRCNR